MNLFKSVNQLTCNGEKESRGSFKDTIIHQIGQAHLDSEKNNKCKYAKLSQII